LQLTFGEFQSLLSDKHCQNQNQEVAKDQLNQTEEKLVSESELKNLWNQELHFPTIANKEKKPKAQKPKIFAITSEKYKLEEEKKKKKCSKMKKRKN
jgi:hypothetical protein